MPPLPSPGQVIKLRWNYGGEDAEATNDLYFSYSGAGALSPTELTNFSTWAGITTDLAAPFVGACDTSFTSRTCQMVDLISDMGAEVNFDPAWTGTNHSDGGLISANNAVVVSKEILRHYRGGHPRLYMMAGVAGDLAASSVKDWQTAFVANIQAGFSAFMEDFPYSLGARTYNPVNVSYWETVAGVRVLRATPLVDLITSMTARTRVCSQRRRLGKVGG